MRQNFSINFWLDGSLSIKDRCLNYIQLTFQNDELRNAAKKDLIAMITCIESLLDTNIPADDDKSEKIHYISEHLELHSAIKCLKMPILERKFIGLSIIASKIMQVATQEKMEAEKEKIQKGSQVNVSQTKKRWFTTKRLVEWMEEENIFFIIFGESLHSEVVKKSYPIIDFLYRNQKIENKEFDIIWDCAIKKHEAYKVAILKALIFIGQKCSLEHLRYLFYKVKSLPLSEIDKFAIQLLRTIAKKLSNINSEVIQPKINTNFVGPYPLMRSNSMKGKGKADELNMQIGSSSMLRNDGQAQFEETFQRRQQFQNQTHFDLADVVLGGQIPKKGRARSFGRGGNSDSNLVLDPTISRIIKGQDPSALQQIDTQQQPFQRNNHQDEFQQDGPSFMNLQNLAQLNREANPLEVPKDRSAENTADGEGSAGSQSQLDKMNLDENDFDGAQQPSGDGDQDMQGFESLEPIRQEHYQDHDQYKESEPKDTATAPATTGNKKKKEEQDLEEEKGGEPNKELMAASLQELLYDQSLGIEDSAKRELANEVLNFIWSLCMEDSVSEHQLSLSMHKLSIEQFILILNYNYPSAILAHLQKCVACIQHNYSVLSVQVILQKLLQILTFPLQPGNKHLPKTRKDFLLALEEHLTITNECLSSYLEFKRMSLSLIFYQLGSQEQEQENLETQSSLDNDDERSSLQSAQKNNNNQQTQEQHVSSNRNDQLNIQEDVFMKDISDNTAGSMYISPKHKAEEEFKSIGFSQKTQSYQGEQQTAQFQSQYFSGAERGKNDFQMAIRESDSEDKLVSGGVSQKQQLVSSGGGGGHANIGGGSSRHVGSSSKRIAGTMQYQQMSGQQKTDFAFQPNYNSSSDMQIDQHMENQNIVSAPTTQNQATSQNNQPQQNNRDFLNQLITNDVYKYSYYQEMQQRLDFLRYLIGNCPALLKPQHIQILWECLVINAFYEKERDQFFGWCTSILKSAQQLPEAKDIDNLGSSIFTDDCLELLFFDTLLKLDFRYITETMYDCFERFMIYINEMYGQIVTNSAFDSAFEVFETKLIGVEALWEIALCVRNEKVYKKAAEFLHKLYKKMSPELVKDRLNEIKEDLLQTCMEQIKTGFKDIKSAIGTDLYEVPIYQFSSSIEDPKNRIARSIQQLCKFIDEFEGLRDRAAKSGLGEAAEKEVTINVKNQISKNECVGPEKFSLYCQLSMKVGEVKDKIGDQLQPKKGGKELNITFRGKDLLEDLKTLKELGLSPEQQPFNFFVTMSSLAEIQNQLFKEENVLENDEVMNSQVENLKNFLGCDLPDAIIKLALKKNNMDLNEAMILLTDEYSVNDLQEEVRKIEEVQQQNQIIILQQEASKAEEEGQKEAKLNLIISNKAEYFDLLFDLLNLGINEITTAAWNLLVQIPVNKQLFTQIRTLGSIQQSPQRNWCQIIDPSNVYKMLYSLQIINSLISVNNDSITEQESKELEEWRLKFLELGGFDHLYMLLITQDIDDLLGCGLSPNKNTLQLGSSGVKRKGKQNTMKAKPQDISNQNTASSNQASGPQPKVDQQIQNNQAKCLGYLISLVKIFLLAALLKVDETKLLTLIVQSSTSPYRKPKNIKSVPSGKFNQLLAGAAGGGLDMSREDNVSKDTSSVNTPKFHSSNSSTPQQCQTPVEDGQSAKGDPINVSQGVHVGSGSQQMNKSLDPIKDLNLLEINGQKNAYSAAGGNGGRNGPGNENNIFTQVDDFPRLVDQMSPQLVSNLLENVINFNELIQKLLHIIYKAVMFCDTSDVSHLVQNSLDLLLPCVVWKPEKLLQEIYKFEHLESLLIRTLMFNSNENVRKSLERTFKVICTQLEIKKQPSANADMKGEEGQMASSNNQQQQDLESPKLYILRILLKNLPDITQQSDQCEEYFNLITSIIKVCQNSFKITQDPTLIKDAPTQKSSIMLEDGTFSATALLQWCIQQLKQRPTFEDKYSQYTDKILAGYLQLTQSVLEIHPELKKITGQLLQEGQDKQYGYDLVKTLFDFLFLLPSLEDQQEKHIKMQSEPKLAVPDTHPKCKRKFTRKKAFNLLLTLCSQCEENFISLLQQLYEFHAQIQKSQKVVSLSDFDADVGVRSATGYVGLKNFGCTCYMNALMQQMFMIKELRQGILQADLEENNKENNVLYQLQQIFANLQESEKQYYAPSGFTSTFRYYGEPINVRVQQDSHEFYNLLCDNIEQLLKGTKDESLLKETIGGQICYETKSLEKEYPYVSERTEPFFAIPLDVKNKKNIQEALDLYIKPDILEGDNKYHCEKYNRHVNGQRRACLGKLSNTVVINLKRFEFDYNSMQRFKVNDYCEFPMQINFKPWTQEGIREEQLKQSKQSNDQSKLGSKRKQSATSSNKQECLDERQLDDFENSEESQSDAENVLGEREDEELFDRVESSKQEEGAGGMQRKDLDEEMESYDDFETGPNANNNTGTYDDDEVVEDLIDIAADDEEFRKQQMKQSTKIIGGNVKQQNSMKLIKKKKDLILSNTKEETKQTIEKSYKSKNQSIEEGQVQTKDKQGQIKQKQLKKKIGKQEEEKDDNYYQYQLVGVLVHSGSADAGHYYSFIKERGSSNRWLEFNDSHVREFKISDLQAECFGGNNNENRPNHTGNMLDDFHPADGRYFERCRNAYLLFYERVNPIRVEKQIGLPLQKQLLNGIEPRIYQRIWEENAAFMKLKIFFDQEYFQFVRDYVNHYNFGVVTYQNQQHSDTYLLKNMRELSEQYRTEYPTLTIDYKKRYQELEQEGKLYGDGDVFGELAQIVQDPGLYTLKLATILSQDIILKVKDIASFSQWMQLMTKFYEGHAVACVWFIKYITDNRSVLEELLLTSTYFEVREGFAKLLMTAISVTAKNEEAYFDQVDEIFDFDCDLQFIQSIKVDVRKCSKSALIRFMDLYFNSMLDSVRVHWTRFDEYFTILKDFLQLGFAEAKYLIQDCRAIYKILEFVMNSSHPFSSIKYKMGSRVQDANFVLPLELLSQLICRCLTPGIENISHYSPLSVFQDKTKHIQLPKDDVAHLFTKATFTQDLLLKPSHYTESIKNIIVYLSWGDLEISKFFITETAEALINQRGHHTETHYKFLLALVRIQDSDELQDERINMLLGIFQAKLAKFDIKLDPALVQVLEQHKKCQLFDDTISTWSKTFLVQKSDENMDHNIENREGDLNTSFNNPTGGQGGQEQQQPIQKDQMFEGNMDEDEGEPDGNINKAFIMPKDGNQDEDEDEEMEPEADTAQIFNNL